jgi:hypothetical protein
MNILKKTYIYPLLLPQKFYIDMHDKANAYIDMNPSMQIDSAGNIKILVRSVNYRKFQNRRFTMFEHQSDSKYTLLTGKIDEDALLEIDSFDIQDVIRENNLPTYSTYWKGMEDIRFIDSENILVTIPECNKDGNPSIFRAKIENNRIYSFQACKPDITEKNWMPYLDEDNNHRVIYSLSPFRIKEIDEDKFIEIKVSEELRNLVDGYHGSTNGIAYDENQILFLIHINKERTYHRWLLFDRVTKKVDVSEEFIFFRNVYIEFPVSLCSYNNRIFISLGVNDEKAFIIETSKKIIAYYI